MNNKKRKIMIITICMILLVTGIVAIVSTINTNKGEYLIGASPSGLSLSSTKGRSGEVGNV